MFTEAQRADVRKYLGWAGRYYQTDSQLEQAMSAVSVDTETRIVAELEVCAAIDTALAGMRTRFKAEEVGGIVLRGGAEMEDLRSQGRQAAGRIAAMLGVEIRHDAFSGSGPTSGGNYLFQ